MGRVLIAGCGDVGSALGLRLVELGHEVWGLRRDPSRLPAALHGIAGDLTKRGDLAKLPPDLELVYYAAAASQPDEAGYRAAYVDGLENVLEVLARRGEQPRRIFFTSSTGAYGQDDGSWVDEDSPTEPQRYTGRIMLEAEALLATSTSAHTAVRLAGIYGPGRTRLLESVRDGSGRCGGPPSYGNRIHRDDCAGLLAHLAQLGEPAPLYVGVDDVPTTRCEVVHWIADRLGVARPHDERSDGPPRGKRCSNRLLSTSGYALRYPSFRDGYGALLGA